MRMTALTGIRREWQPVNSEQVKEHGELATRADVFRRIGLDERDHTNMSFLFCGKPKSVIEYDGLPEKPGLIHSK